MKAREGAENIYICQTGFTMDHTVAIFNKDTNTLEISEGYAKSLPKILGTLRNFQQTYNKLVSPIKVEYW